MILFCLIVLFEFLKRSRDY